MSAVAERPVIRTTTLEEMGIKRAHEIASYSLRAKASDKDVLKIRYKRTPGSLLPESRTYKFGRALKSVIADGGTSRMAHTYEISPFLLKAIAELDELVSDNNKSVTSKAPSQIGEEKVGELLKELYELESMISSRMPMTSAAAVSARFSRLKAQLAAL